MSDEPRCSATVFGERVHSWSCTRRGVVQRKDKWYCRIHDPEFITAKRAAKTAAYKAERAAEDAIEREATELARQLGCGTYYWSHGPQKALVLTFEEVRALIARLPKL